MKSDPILQEWFIKKNLSENSIKNYTNGFKHYLNYLNSQNNTNYTPTTLLMEAEEEERKGELLRYRKINQHIIGFITYLKNEGKSPGTINNRLAIIESFYKTMNIALPFIERYKGDTVLEKNQNRALKKEELLKMVEIASPRNKAIIYTMALTGTAQNEITNLTIKKFAESISEELDNPITNIQDLFESEKLLKNSILTLKIRREKANHDYFTFLPPEAHSRIFAYLKTRLESNNPELHPRMNSPLFVNRYGNKLTRSGIVKIFTNLGEILQLQHDDGSFRYYRSHALRKYFISTIYNKTGDLALADFLAGHKPGKVTKAYTDPDHEELLERYKLVYPHISIDTVKVKDFKSKEFIKLENQLEKNQEELKTKESRIYNLEEKMNEKDKDFLILKKRMDLYEKLMEDEEFRDDL